MHHTPPPACTTPSCVCVCVCLFEPTTHADTKHGTLTLGVLKLVATHPTGECVHPQQPLLGCPTADMKPGVKCGIYVRHVCIPETHAARDVVGAVGCACIGCCACCACISCIGTASAHLRVSTTCRMHLPLPHCPHLVPVCSPATQN